MRERIARFMVRWRETLRPALGLAYPAHPAPAPLREYTTAPVRLPAVVDRADPPTLRLPRLPAGDRFPIAWDTDPVPLYVLRHEHLRTLGTR